MSQNDEQYKGKLPRPSKTQTIKEFEDEEIKPDPEYTEFNSVAEILAKPEYFKLIIEQPEFQSMLEREGVANPLAATPQASKEEKKEKKVDVEPDGSKADAGEEEPKAAIDVVMVPSLEEVAPVTDDAPIIDDATLKVFDPEYRRIMNKVSAPVEINVTHGIATLDKAGIEDLLVDYSGDRTTKKGEKFHSFLQTFRPMARIEPLTYDDATGAVQYSNHAYVFDEAVAGSSAKTHEYELKRVRPKIVANAPNVGAQRMAMITVGDRPAQLTDDVDDDELVDLSLESRGTGIRIKGADVIINPFRLPFLLRDMISYRDMTLTFAEWRNVHDRLINPIMFNYIRTKNAKERDVITNTHMKRSMYDRFIIGAGDFDSLTYYYTDLPNMRNYQVCESVLNRSLSRGMEAMSKLSTSSRSISTNLTNRQASHMLLGMTSIQPSDAVNFARQLGGFLLGGKRRTLEVDIEDGATKTPMLNALCSFANLILIDCDRFLDARSYTQLVVNALLPFYDEFPVMRTGQNAPSKTVHDIASDFMNDIIQMPPITKLVDTTGRGFAKAREIRAILTNLFTRLLNNRYQQLNDEGRMFITPAPAPFTPFVARADIIDIVLFGTRTDGFESRMHEIASYRPEALRMCNMLEEYADVLGKLRQYDGVGLAMSEAMKTKTHVAKSMAIFMDSFVHGSTHTELLAPEHPVDDQRSVDTIMLPFDGALSFLLYGIGSSEIADTTDAYVRFKSLSAPALPSLYPVYLYVERAIVQRAYNVFSQDPTPFLITHREMVIDVCIDALKVYFTSVDPDSRDRISNLFDDSRMLDLTREFDLPDSLVSSIFSGHRYDPGMGSDGQEDLPGSFYTNADIADNVKGVNAYTSALEAVDKVVREVYIDFEPIIPTTIETYSTGSTFVYTGERDANEYVDLHEVLTNTRYIDSDTLTVESIKNLAKAYLRERDVRSRGVRISNVRTSFKFVEHKGLSDIVVDTPTITIDRNSKYLDTQFEVSEVSVYYHRLTDRQGQLREGVIDRELSYLNGFMTYVSIDQRAIQNYLMNFDHADPMNPSIYRIRDRGEIERLAEDSIAALKLRDGRGITYAGRVTLSTRESEEIDLVKEFNSQEELFPLGRVGNIGV